MVLKVLLRDNREEMGRGLQGANDNGEKVLHAGITFSFAPRQPGRWRSTFKKLCRVDHGLLCIPSKLLNLSDFRLRRRQCQAHSTDARRVEELTCMAVWLSELAAGAKSKNLLCNHPGDVRGNLGGTRRKFE